MREHNFDLQHKHKEVTLKTTNGTRMIYPHGIEVTKLLNRDRVFYLPVKNWTKRFIKRVRYGL